MNEPLQEGLDKALRRLREDVATQAAPDALESRLLASFQNHHVAVRQRQRRWMWAPAAIAAALVVAVVSRMPAPVKVEAPAIPLASVPVPAPVVDGTPVVQTKSPKPGLPSKRRGKRATKQPLSLAKSKPAPEPQEFMEIPYAPPFTPYDEGHVLRVNMAGSSVRRMGIPVLTDRVQADLVVGNDGLPRAIRLVSNTGSQFR
jgi:hypothetical protein